MMGGHRRLKKFGSRTSERGATQLGFLDIMTAIVVLAILVYAASRQFPAYRTAPAPASEQSQAH
jgi:hypothetical protein